jgi:hypothetical protein
VSPNSTETERPGRPERSSPNRGLLVLLIVSVALMVIGVVRCSTELTAVEDAAPPAGSVSEVDP